MNGIHDLGGMHGFGAVLREENEPPFHARWEGRVYAFEHLLGERNLFSLDAFRHAIERLEPAVYLSSSYYQRWQLAIERLLLELGHLRPGELEARQELLAAGGQPAEGRPDRQLRGDVPAAGVRDVDRDPAFAVGDRVRARNLHPSGHTRLPRYVRGKTGRIERIYPACVFPDTNAHREGECPQHLYHVLFDGRELWGDDAEPLSSLGIDLFESYLEAMTHE